MPFAPNWARLEPAYARSKNLTPYDVLTIASMIEEETLPPRSASSFSAVIYNGCTPTCARIDAALRCTADESPPSRAQQRHLRPENPQHRTACRRRRSLARLASLQRPRITEGRTISTSSRSRTKRPLLHGQLGRVQRYKAEHGYG
jgi:hypothetical protein